MITTLTCDRCGATYQEEHFNHGDIVVTKYGITGYEYRSPMYRLCHCCLNDLEVWFNKGKNNALS